MKEGLVSLIVAMLGFVLPSFGLAQEMPQPQVPPAPQAEAVPSVPGIVLEEIEGIYVSVGINADGDQYQQAVTISSNGDSLDVLWVNKGGEVTARGIGFLENDVLAIAFVASKGELGLATYRLDQKEKEKFWSGSWSVFGSNGKRFPEVMSKVAPLTEEDRNDLKELPSKPKTSPPAKAPAKSKVA
ncbi:MAG: hypothetical protein A2655_04550 [Candidatus Yanofskybacteria bacterium RIFCSPHIGHO2_01_FULL_43_42]|uniref:Uncharacterized protein n=1 Tax=Candidatus Yanofskybacteria bacterium RIFCSPLOWO2_01_FULL_43_22 TaxID=1802695 RepID=A0A1F8GDD9_9BACT|nr:MAG: hypothetical protein A2655_04550 [Candidatus Yanofskybacteria bacterium RIFCSPHIGHO2_01_FULL_43_42]OGN13527.1 MAG: hypothetical protein A3D48_02110 [Candidatus Yanofskybacteria bacterium RIFCSPHIGHO2_02_FULL_43_17]OGN23382.1 MAG: hypothetical protein A3A13_04675 [Candidatus Yanofskybacteria bacterium RIFCSPLOWO2_01_FULL_43_22]